MNEPVLCPRCSGTGHRILFGPRVEYCVRCGGAQFVLAETVTHMERAAQRLNWSHDAPQSTIADQIAMSMAAGVSGLHTRKPGRAATLAEWYEDGDALFAPREARAR